MALSNLGTYQNRAVLVTGHTGFKGSWLALWLHKLGARVTGYALDPPSDPNHFDASDVASILAEDVRADIRDAETISSVVSRCQPDFVFHLAAQPIVRSSLVSPRETFDINVVGTSSVLDAVRTAGHPCSVVVITSDKCYRNEGQVWGFREDDPLGGHDPYSASKAGTELVVGAYRDSYFHPDLVREHGVRLASARAGNVIGGGDWAADRIVPDAVRSLASDTDLVVRNPASTRPWQHVLEPLSGYLDLGVKLAGDEHPERWSQAWNFGPLPSEEATVAELASSIVSAWGSGRWTTLDATRSDVEATTLRISIDKAISELGWHPRWQLEETVRRTVDWYHQFYNAPQKSMRLHSLADIDAYTADST